MKPGKASAVEDNTSSLEKSNEHESVILQHINDTDIHTSSYEKEQISELIRSFSSHKNNGDIHVSEEQLKDLSSRETPSGAQEKANKVKSLLQRHENDSDSHLTTREKEEFRDKYTRSEVNALISSIISGINWVEEVETYDQISIVHPNPSVKDTCTVLDTGLSYTYNGKIWVVSFVSFIPVATTEYDGTMSKEDKQKLDNIDPNANFYTHPDDEFSRHVSDEWIRNWDNKANDEEASTIKRGLMSPTDKKKIDTVEYNANFYEHPTKHHFSMIETDKDHQFVSQEQIDSFESKVAPERLEEEINAAVDETKRYINNVIAKLSNSTPELYNLLISIRQELSADAAGVLLKEIAAKLDSDTFRSHADDDTRHVSSELMNKINDLLSNPRVDWNETNIDSPRYIKNKPDALPAKGGNSDTVGGFKPEVLFSNRKAATITIGTLTANCTKRSVDFICDGTNDTAVIQEAFNAISSFGGNILFREGTYIINDRLTLNGNHITLDSCNATFVKKFSDGVLLNISGDDCVVKNFTFTHDTYPNMNNLFISIVGSRNSVLNNHFNNGSAVEIGSGSYNKIADNMIVNPFCGIKVIPEKGNATCNHISNNVINGGQYGIILKSSSWSILNNFIRNNEVLNCGVGITLTASVPINDKVAGCDIRGNYVLRGFGDDSSYGTNQKDILVEYGFKNIISGNTLKKIEIRGSKNLANNMIL